MRDGFLRGSRYSPGNMDRESLEALFVGRDDVMEDVLSRAMESIRSANKHYVLLVGPRGSGKTHLLALASHLLMDRIKAAKADDKVAVALLNEEEWGVASFLDLVVGILRALTDQTPELSTDIDTIYGRFSKDPIGAEAFAVNRLRQHTHGRTLLVLCENLVDLFDGLGEEGQKRWRAIIQEDGNWAIVATTPSLFSAVALQDNPFYGFFTIRSMHQIDFDTGLNLLERKAVHEGKTELAEYLRQPLGRARVRAVHHLAAGNYRAYVVLFDFLDKESLDDLTRPFFKMVDDLTPYYQDRMRQLAPAQRKIVEFLCRHRKPATIKDISTSCLMSHQTTAKQISELYIAGFVTRTRAGRNTFCELSEPLMRICIEVKDNKAQHIHLFVEFLRHWFTNNELEKRHIEFERDDHGAEADRCHIAEAVKRSRADKRDPALEALTEEGQRAWDAHNYSALAIVQEKLVRDGHDTAPNYDFWLFALIQIGETRTAVDIGYEAASKHPSHAGIRYLLSDALYDNDRLVEALSVIDEAIAIDRKEAVYPGLKADILVRLERFEEALVAIDSAMALNNRNDATYLYQNAVILMNLERFEEALVATDRGIAIDGDKALFLCIRSDILLDLERFEEAIEDAKAVLDIEPQHWHSFEQMIKASMAIGRSEDAEAYVKELVQQGVDDARALLVASEFYFDEGRFGDAIPNLDTALAVDPGNHRALRLRGEVLFEMEDYDRAIVDLRRFVSEQPESIPGHCRLAHSLFLAGDYEAAIEVAMRLLDLDPMHGHAHVVRGDALVKLGRSEEAVAAFDDLLSTSDCPSLLHAASGAREFGDYTSAHRYLDRVSALQPDDPELWMERVRSNIDEGDFDEAARNAAVIEAMPGKSLLGRLFGARVRAATQPLSAAFEVLGGVVEPQLFEDSEGEHLAAIVGALTSSLRSFGPQHLAQGLAKLRDLLRRFEDGVVGRVLTDFLKENAEDGFAGPLEEWEQALNGVAANLADLSDCHIPVEMLRAAVTYSKTGDVKRLMSLPLEQRQLLESILPSDAGTSAS